MHHGVRSPSLPPIVVLTTPCSPVLLRHGNDEEVVSRSDRRAVHAVANPPLHRLVRPGPLWVPQGVQASHQFQAPGVRRDDGVGRIQAGAELAFLQGGDLAHLGGCYE